MRNKPEKINETLLHYAPGSAERKAVQQKLTELKTRDNKKPLNKGLFVIMLNLQVEYHQTTIVVYIRLNSNRSEHISKYHE